MSSERGSAAGARGDAAGPEPQVLVVGAGPTGLTLAGELLRHGVRVRVVDQARGPSDAPRALSLWPRALDILDDLGAGAAIRAAGRRIETFGYFSEGRRVATFHFPPALASTILPQPRIEHALTESLHALGGRVERGVRLVRMTGHQATGLGEDRLGGPVVAELEHDDGTVEQVRPAFVVGADGASSTVRAQMGVHFSGDTYEMAFALVDAHVEGVLSSTEIRYYQTSSGTLVIVPAPDGVFRFLSVVPSGVAEAAADVAAMQAVLDERGPAGVRIVEPVWQSVFRVHTRRATHFRRGRVFLAGDAAHVHSPAGGQGMNSGLQDAHNLGWRLAAVLGRRAPEDILYDYEPERSETARRVVRDTNLHTRAWVVRGRTRRAARDLALSALDRSGMMERWYVPVLAGRRLLYPPPRPTQSPSTRCAVGGGVGAGGGIGPGAGVGGAGIGPGSATASRRSPSRLTWSSWLSWPAWLPGGSAPVIGPGAVFPRQALTAFDGAERIADPTAWILAVIPPTDPAQGGPWFARLARLVEGRAQVRVVIMDPDASPPDALGEDAAEQADHAEHRCCRNPASYYLIRPDGHVAAHGHAEDLARLEAELHHQTLRTVVEWTEGGTLELTPRHATEGSEDV
ncbi:FAD-dependent monooxygenase [Actinospica durhamensis]|uniref:FAD-dependent monooxygenase n=1 Tax=Actinospica durhamensis TaxID=1508375 RepID=A0A941IUR0_9ACTN|nr:FAD-dependent monooxygenase [Actinospica durhamensis]MBR7839487.1 FAD-dependent monooxygenase [Actinospica durhamensis]